MRNLFLSKTLIVSQYFHCTQSCDFHAHLYKNNKKDKKQNEKYTQSLKKISSSKEKLNQDV